MGEVLGCPPGQGLVSQVIQAGFLNFGTADVWGNLCFGGGRGGRCPVYCRELNGLPGHDPGSQECHCFRCDN